MRRYEEKYFKWLCVVFFSMHLVFVRPSKMLNSSPHFPLPLLPSSPSLNSDGVCPHFIVSLCLSPDMLSFLSPRPPGMEAATTPMRTWRDEKKWRRSWRRGSTPWCVRVDALIIRSAPSFPTPSLAELDSDQRKQLLSSQAWWRLGRGDMCRFPASSLKTGIKDYSGATEEETEWKEIILFIEAVLVCLSRPEARWGDWKQ